MVLMASDHAAEAFNAGRLAADSVFLYDPRQMLGTLQFANRWVSHLCAPTFLFLAGTSLALSIERKTQRGVASSRIDRDLLIRGLIILSVDLFIINLFWEPGLLLLQVMYAIGLAMILMVPLRRLPTSLLIIAALVVLVSAELFLGDEIVVPFEPAPVAGVFLMRFGVIDMPIESVGFRTTRVRTLEGPLVTICHSEMAIQDIGKRVEFHLLDLMHLPNGEHPIFYLLLDFFFDLCQDFFLLFFCQTFDH